MSNVEPLCDYPLANCQCPNVVDEGKDSIAINPKEVGILVVDRIRTINAPPKPDGDEADDKMATYK